MAPGRRPVARPPKGGPNSGPIFFWDADVAPKIAFFIKRIEVFSTIVYGIPEVPYISLHFITF